MSSTDPPLSDAIDKMLANAMVALSREARAVGFDARKINVRKALGYTPVSRQVLLEEGLVEPTAEERAEADRRRAEAERRHAERTARMAEFTVALDQIGDPLARAVLHLHGPRYSDMHEHGRCEGCYADGYEWEPPAWPCTTTEIVARHYGIQAPE